MRTTGPLRTIALAGLLVFAAVGWAAEQVPPAAPLPDPFAGDGQRVLDLEIDPNDIAIWDTEPKTWVPTTLRLDGHVLREVHVRQKGNSSLRPIWTKSALKIDLRRAVVDRRLDGRKGWNLHNGVHDCGLAREALAYAALRQLGLPSVQTGLASMRLNRVEKGAFVVVELQDDVWLAREAPHVVRLYDGKFRQDEDGNLLKADLTPDLVHRLELDVGDDVAQADLLQVVEALEDPTIPLDALPVDWAQVRRTMATEEWIGQWDGYARNRNNYLLAVDDRGRIQILITDLDKAFRPDRGWDWLGWEGNEGERGILAERCFADDTCHAAYLEALRQVDAELDIESLQEGLDAWMARLQPSWATDPVMAICSANEQSGLILETWLDIRSDYVATRLREAK